MTSDKAIPTNPNWAFLQAAIKYNAMLAEFVLLDAAVTVSYAGRLSDVMSARELDDFIIRQTRDRFDALSRQADELSAFMSPDRREDTRLCFWD